MQLSFFLESGDPFAVLRIEASLNGTLYTVLSVPPQVPSCAVLVVTAFAGSLVHAGCVPQQYLAGRWPGSGTRQNLLSKSFWIRGSILFF